jgi:hypothetical protein
LTAFGRRCEVEESILTSTKKILGIAEDYTEFDLDIITHINASFGVLNQLGLGEESGFFIDDASSVWTDYIGQSPVLSLIRTYVFLKVRFLFDPPATSFLITAVEEQINQHEWRISVFRESEMEVS